MTNGKHESTGRLAVPPPQHNFEEAAAKALAAVRIQPAEQLQWLGARRTDDFWTVHVLDDELGVDLEAGTVRTSAGRDVGDFWRVLTLHYLAVPGRAAEEPPAVTFADLPAGRAYAGVYRQRVIERLCRTAGKTEQALRQACEKLGAQDAPGGNLAMDFQVYPCVRLRLIWYAGDEELISSAVFLLPGNIESFFCLEDIVVLSERIVSRLSGGRF